MNKKEVEKIAHLARLELSEDEAKEYASSLTNILQLVEHINDANTEGMSPMAHPLTELNQRLRDDQVTESNHREAFQSLTMHTEEGVYLVPKVIED